VLPEAVELVNVAGEALASIVNPVPIAFIPRKRDEARTPERLLLHYTVERELADRIRAAGLTPIPIWRLSHNAALSIADAARRLRVNAIMVGVSQRSQLVHMLRGSVLKGLHRLLPGDEILIHTVG